MLGPQPSSEVELTEAPADRRPLRNLLADATLVRGLPAMLPALPRCSHEKRTPARIAHLLPSLRYARARPSLIIPTWQACPPRSPSELYIIFPKLLKSTRSSPTKKIKKKIIIFFFARRQVRKLYPSPAQLLGGAFQPRNGLLTPLTSPPRPPRDSNRLTAPCFHAAHAHLRRAMCAPITWQGARKSTTPIVGTDAALGAASGTFRLPPEFLRICLEPWWTEPWWTEPRPESS